MTVNGSAVYLELAFVHLDWPIASFALLGLALAAGFAWYERSHPSSKVLALVAALAALAVAGRVAFAPLPNVKPTTDIVLLAGFALGGAPGFAVGAVAALASNLFFGQGPWTPWQMAAWGLVGVLGAALGAASGRRLGRVPLAIACGVAGLLFGAIMDFSTWVTFSGSHTLGGYLAFSATSAWFNVAHAAGNVVFCLAFGPALVRALLRFRERFTIHWEPVAAVGLALAALGAPLAAAPAASAASPASYLLRAQNRDGGLGAAPRQRSSTLYSAWAAMGLGASGHRSRALVRYLDRGAPSARQPGDVERTILALVAQHASPRRAGGVDLVHRLGRGQRRDGSWSGLVNQTSFGVLALKAARAGAGQVRRGGRWIARQQNRDGGFNFARRGGASGIDDTAGAVQALVAASGRGGRVPNAARFLVRNQNPDGGFGVGPRAPSNAQSTAWAIQALVAAGRDPARVRRHASRSPLAYLRTLIGGDGAVRYSRTSRQTPVWVTAQALTALARRPFPIR
ncbi:MAG: prenyltransferase/squalene oxidase repeat-containing protein [Solirubrobacteraceae bacterium]